ncbi:MAG: hypothetical protein VZR10_09865 [Methanobrevibacter sp.]|nr:hypothetical protein [Methanobrevibacter sp.]
MKNNTEIKRTQYTIDQLVNHHLIYTGFTINDENYGVDDAWLISLKHTAFPLENKTILGDFNFKEDGAFRPYFKEDLPNKMRLECEIPEDTPIYYLNAEAHSGLSKWEKVIESGACVSFLAADGIVLFSPKDLKEAFLGYGYDNVSHKTEFGAKGKRQWEKKALLDLSRGFFIPCKTPKELITKNYN